MNRRNFLLTAIAATTATSIKARPYDGNLIKVIWGPIKAKMVDSETKEPMECWFGDLFINGGKVKSTLVMWHSGSIEEMDSSITRASNLFKQQLHRVLRTTEYDAVIDNSTSDFYYE